MPPKKKTQKVETPEEQEEDSASESEPEPSKPTKKSAFAMMMDSDDDDEDEEEEKSSPSPKKSEKSDSGKKQKEEVSEEIAMFGEKKKKKKKDGEEKEDKDTKKEKKEKKDKKEGKEKKKKGPTVCEVTEVSAIPKKDKLKLCKVTVAPGIEGVEIVTSAPNVIAGRKFIAAPPGCTTANGIEVNVSKVGGVESAGMFCGPKELGWDTDVLDENLAVMLADSAEVGSLAPPYEEAVAAFQQREKEEKEAKEAKQKEEEAKAAANAKEDKKGKKKKGKAAKEDDEDLDELLAEFKGEAPADPPAEKAEESAPKETAGAKSASQKKKDKKKGNKGATDGDDDFDAALEDFKPEAETAKPDEAQEDKDDKGDEEGLDAKTLANRKKKEKKKAKQQEKTGGEGMWATSPGEAEPAPESKEQPASSSKDEAPAAAAKKGAKKESAIVKAARERLEQEQKLAEEKRAFEEAEKLRVEEEQRQIEEEERKKEEERQRKRDHKAAKIAKQKAEGTYLTKKQKEQAKRAAQLREQFGYSMAKDDDEDGEEEAEKPQRRPMATKKKKKPQRKEDAEQETEQPEEKEMPAREEPKKPEPEKPKEETKEEEDDDDDDWEKKLEENEVEESSKEAEAKAEESDDDKESDSGSESSSSSDSSSSSFTPLRSPVICIMGHVDTGKTKLLDKIRRTNVQEGEAGGITQQIGATFFPDIALEEQTRKVDEDFGLEVPGVLIIDTPGHESFNNLRMRGSSLADLAILVIDIMHGLEPQTVESLELLKKRRCPFIIALNKIDILYKWNAKSYTSVQEALSRQEQSVRDEFQTRFQNVVLQLNERGLNCNLYWENADFKTSVSIVPTSALTGEGVPDLLYMILKLTQDLMVDKLEAKEELECTVIEVKNIEGLGTTIDVVLLNGTLREGDTIVLAGMGGPIVTTIRALLTPQPMKEMRVKNEYVHHAQINTSMGVKISAPGLEDAVAGTELLVLGPDDDLEELKEDVSEGFESILNDFEKEPAGVYVKASTLGSLEALLSFLQDMKIPVFDVGIGEVHKRDVKKACIMKEKKHPEYALILAFDVKVNQEAQKQADTDGVTIFTADIIYHLQDKFTKYMEKFRESQKTETRKVAVFPVVLQIDKQHVFRKQDPIIVGCQVQGGQLRVGTPLCIPDKGNMAIGHVSGIENNKKSVNMARRGDTVCVKIEQTTAQNHIMYGRHFDFQNKLYSQITRQSIDTLKEHFKDEMKKEDWELVIGMKKIFEIQ